MDTRRDLSSLQTLLANNNVGAISEQDLRDFLFSMKLAVGSFYVTASAPTTISVPGTFYKAAGTTSLSDNTAPYLFDMPVNNRLRYTGTTSIHAHIAGTISIRTAGSSDLLAVKIVKNGTTELNHSYVPRFVQTGSDVGSVPIHADCPMAENDYLEIWLTNEDAAVTVTLYSGYLYAMGMFV